MSPPLPGTLARLLAAPGTNRSLWFDRAFPESRNGEVAGEAKRSFLAAVAGRPAGADYAELLARRRAALAAGEGKRLAAVKLYTASRLVVGLGLPTPVETGLLLDRLTGSPYLPGSSIKGVLRSAAELAAAGELEVPGAPDAAGFWHQHRERLFGPALVPGARSRRGAVTFYDAFPVTWARLELDVMTPHQSEYYGGADKPPADWHEPIPVPFLAVATGTAFEFPLEVGLEAAAAEEAPERVKSLLQAALSTLGIGGKTSGGYGLFSPQPPAPPAVAVAPSAPPGNRGPRTTFSPTPPPPSRQAEPARPVTETRWTSVTLELERGQAVAYRGKSQRAGCDPGELPADLRRRLKKKKDGVRADLVVVQGVAGWRIAAVESWEG